MDKEVDISDLVLLKIGLDILKGTNNIVVTNIVEYNDETAQLIKEGEELLEKINNDGLEEIDPKMIKEIIEKI